MIISQKLYYSYFSVSMQAWEAGMAGTEELGMSIFFHLVLLLYAFRYPFKQGCIDKNKPFS